MVTPASGNPVTINDDLTFERAGTSPAKDPVTGETTSVTSTYTVGEVNGVRISGYGADGYSNELIPYVDVLNDKSVFRGGNGVSNFGSGYPLDDDPNDFAAALPYGTVYIDTKALTFGNGDNVIVEINPSYADKFIWYSKEGIKDHTGEHQSTIISGSSAYMSSGIAYVGGLDAYLSNTTEYQNTPKDGNGKVTNHNWLNAPANNNGVTKEISDPKYLYRITFIDAATLPDGTKGDLVLTTKGIRMEGSIDVDAGIPIGIQGPNQIGIKANLYNPANSNAPLIPQRVNVTTSNGTVKATRVGFGLEMDLDIQVQDKENNPVPGSISYSVYDLDVETRQEIWGRPAGMIDGVPAAERFKYNEGITINNGALSYAVYPNYDHQYEGYATYGLIRTPKTYSGGNYTEFYDTPMIVSRVAPGTHANGVRFMSVSEARYRDKDGTFNKGYIDSDGLIAPPNTNKSTFNTVLQTEKNGGAYSATRNDKDTFDTGFAVLLDSAGASFTWSGSGFGGSGPMGTTLFDTSVFTRIEQTHGTGGGIYLEGYPLTDDNNTSCKPQRFEGTVTMGYGSDATVTMVPEDGYRVQTIYVGGKKFEIVDDNGTSKLKLPDGSIQTFGSTSDSYTKTDGTSETRNITQGVKLTSSAHGIADMDDLIIEKNDDGTYDVTLKNVRKAKHVHVDFSADYYFYKVWKGDSEPTSLNMTATPFAFVFRDVTIDGTKYTIDGTTFTDPSGNNIEMDGASLTIAQPDGSEKLYYLEGNELVHYNHSDPDNPKREKAYPIRLDYVKNGAPVTFEVTKEDADNGSETNVIKATEDGKTVWKIRYPAEGYKTKSGKTWPALPIETEPDNHDTTHVERNYWFATEEAPGWALVSYDNTSAEVSGRISQAKGRNEHLEYEQSDDKTFSNWASTSVKDYNEAKKVIGDAAANDYAYMSVFSNHTNAITSDNSWGGKITNIPAVVVNAEKTWDDYSNDFKTRQDVWFHIDATIDGTEIKDYMPPQKLSADSSKDVFTLTWGEKKAYGDTYLNGYTGSDFKSRYEGYKKVKVVGNSSDVPRADSSGMKTYYYVADSVNPQRYLPKLVDGKDADGNPKYVDDREGTVYYVNELTDTTFGGKKIKYKLRETDAAGNAVDNGDDSKFLKGYKSEIGNVTKDSNYATVGGVKVASYTGKIKNTLLTTDFTVKKRWQDDADKTHTDAELSDKLKLFDDNGSVADKTNYSYPTPTITPDQDNPSKGYVVKWEKLPKYIGVNESGSTKVKKATYYATEDSFTGYSTKYSNIGDNTSETAKALDGGTIINTQQTVVKATKAWDDKNDKYGLRQDAKLSLTADGSPVQNSEKTISKDATGYDLTVTWVGLDKYRDGTDPIIYKVVEADVSPYSQEITGDAESGFTVTNTYPPKTETKIITREIIYTYIDKDGLEASETVTQKIKIMREPHIVNPETGTITWDKWSIVDETENKDIPSPSITGWDPDKSSVQKWTPTDEELQAAKDSEAVHVIYSPDNPKAEPMVSKDGQFDSSDGKLKTQTSGAPKFTLGIETLHTGEKNSFTYKLEVPTNDDGTVVEGAEASDGGKKVNVRGEGVYTLNDDGSITFTPQEGFTGKAKGVRITGIDKLKKSVTTTYTPIVVPNKETQTIERVIEYKYNDKDGNEVTDKRIQTAIIERIGDYDPSRDNNREGYDESDSKNTISYTGKNNGWKAADLENAVSPADEGGWVPDTDEIAAVTDITPKNAEEKGFTKEKDPESGEFKWRKTEVVIYTPEPPAAIDAETYGIPRQVQTQDAKELFTVKTSKTAKDDNGNRGDNDIIKIKLIDPNTMEETDEPVAAVDENGNEIGTYTLNPETGLITFKPNDDYDGAGDSLPVEVRGTDKNGLSAVAKYRPHFKPNAETYTGSRTITYRYDDGTPVLDESGKPITVTQTVTFTRTASVDPKTGELKWSEWNPADASVPDVTSPKIDGWETDLTVVNGVSGLTKENADDKLKDVTVYYHKPPTAGEKITYGGKGETQKGTPTFTKGSKSLTAFTLVDDEGNPFDKIEVSGVGTYTCDPKTGEVTFTPDPEFIGEAPVVTVRGTDENGYSADGKYKPIVVDNTESKTVTRTIEYVYEDKTPVKDEDGNPVTVKQELEFTRTGAVDAETGNITWPDWTPKEYAEVVSNDQVPENVSRDYVPDKKTVEKEAVTPTDGDKTVQVVYKKLPWAMWVDPATGEVIKDRTTFNADGTEPSAPSDPSRDGYRFAGWDRTVDADGNVTYKAKWEEAPKVKPTEPEKKPEPEVTQKEPEIKSVPAKIDKKDKAVKDDKSSKKEKAARVQKSSTKRRPVETGDTRDIYLWLGIFAAAIAAACVCMVRRLRER